MNERVKVTGCAGLGWLALWVFLIWLLLSTHLDDINNSLKSIAASQQRIAARHFPVDTETRIEDEM